VLVLDSGLDEVEVLVTVVGVGPASTPGRLRIALQDLTARWG
jgi:hypothetical protein